MNEQVTHSGDATHLKVTSFWMIFYMFMLTLTFVVLVVFFALNLGGEIAAVLFVIPFAFLMWALFNPAYQIETQAEGLIIRRFLQQAKLIKWADIQKVTIRYNRGWWCIIRHGTGLFDIVRFWAADGFFESSRNVERLANVIASAAGLTITGYTFFWRKPIYERIDMHV